MSQNQQVSRYEVNRNVRMVFTRHDADLTKIDYSYTGNTVYLYGDLVRPDGDFSAQDINTLAREIAALPHVRDIQFNLNNLTMVSSGDSWQVTRTKKALAAAGAAHQSGSLGDSTVIIKKVEKLKVVLDDLQSAAPKDTSRKFDGSTGSR